METATDNDANRKSPPSATFATPSPDCSRPNSTTKGVPGQRQYLGFPTKKIDIEPRHRHEDFPTKKESTSPTLEVSDETAHLATIDVSTRPDQTAVTCSTTKRKTKTANGRPLVDLQVAKGHHKGSKQKASLAPIIIPSAGQNEIASGTDSKGTESDFSSDESSPSVGDITDFDDDHAQTDDVKSDEDEAQLQVHNESSNEQDNNEPYFYPFEIRSSAPAFSNKFTRTKHDNSHSERSVDLTLAPLHIGKAKLFQRHASCQLLPITKPSQTNAVFGQRALARRNSTCFLDGSAGHWVQGELSVLSQADPISAVSFVNSDKHVQTLVNTKCHGDDTEIATEDCQLVTDPFYSMEYGTAGLSVSPDVTKTLDSNNDTSRRSWNMLADPAESIMAGNGPDGSETNHKLTNSRISNGQRIDVDEKLELQGNSRDVDSPNRHFLYPIQNFKGKREHDNRSEPMANFQCGNGGIERNNSDAKPLVMRMPRENSKNSLSVTSLSCDGSRVRLIPKTGQMDSSTNLQGHGRAGNSCTRSSDEFPEHGVQTALSEQLHVEECTQSTVANDDMANENQCLNDFDPEIKPQSTKRICFREASLDTPSDEPITSKDTTPDEEDGRQRDRRTACQDRVSTPHPGGVFMTAQHLEMLHAEDESVSSQGGLSCNEKLESSCRLVTPKLDRSYGTMTNTVNHLTLPYPPPNRSYSVMSDQTNCSLGFDHDGKRNEEADGQIAGDDNEICSSSPMDKIDVEKFHGRPSFPSVVRFADEEHSAPNIYVNVRKKLVDLSERNHLAIQYLSKHESEQLAKARKGTVHLHQNEYAPARNGSIHLYQNECSVKYRKYFDVEESRKLTTFKSSFKPIVSVQEIKFPNSGSPKTDPVRSVEATSDEQRKTSKQGNVNVSKSMDSQSPHPGHNMCTREVNYNIDRLKASHTPITDVPIDLSGKKEDKTLSACPTLCGTNTCQDVIQAHETETGSSKISKFEGSIETATKYVPISSYNSVIAGSAEQNQTFLTEVATKDSTSTVDLLLTQSNFREVSEQRNSSVIITGSRSIARRVSPKPIRKLFQEYSQREEEREANSKSGCSYVGSQHGYALAKPHVCFKCLRLQRSKNCDQKFKNVSSLESQTAQDKEIEFVKGSSMPVRSTKQKDETDFSRKVAITCLTCRSRNFESCFCACPCPSGHNSFAGMESKKSDLEIIDVRLCYSEGCRATSTSSPRKGRQIVPPGMCLTPRSTSYNSNGLTSRMDIPWGQSYCQESDWADSKLPDDETMHVVQQLKVIQHCRQGALSKFLSRSMRKESQGVPEVQSPRVHHSMIASLMVPHAMTPAASKMTSQSDLDGRICVRGANFPLLSPPVPATRPQISVCSVDEVNRLAQYGTAMVLVGLVFLWLSFVA